MSKNNAIKPVAEFRKLLKNKLQSTLTQIFEDDKDNYIDFVTPQKRPKLKQGNYYTR